MLTDIHPFIHTFTHRRRSQPRRGRQPARSGAVRVRASWLIDTSTLRGIKLATFWLPANPPHLLSHIRPQEGFNADIKAQFPFPFLSYILTCRSIFQSLVLLRPGGFGRVGSSSYCDSRAVGVCRLSIFSKLFRAETLASIRVSVSTVCSVCHGALGVYRNVLCVCCFSTRAATVPGECVSANFTLSDSLINPSGAALPRIVYSGANANAQTNDLELIYLSLQNRTEL